MTPIIERITADPEWLLAQLALAYDSDRAARDRENPPHSLHNRCRYCLGSWRRFQGTPFDGHATCIVSHRFQQQATELLDSSPAMTYQRVADRLGVGVGVVRAWWNTVKGNPKP